MPAWNHQAKTDSYSERARSWLTPEQVTRLKTGALDGRYQALRDRDVAAIALMYETGIRVGELVALDVDNLVLDRRDPHLKLQAGIQKAGGPGYIEFDLDQEAANTMRRYLDHRPWTTRALFPSRTADRASENSIRRAVISAAKRAGVRPHVAAADRVRGEPEEVTPHTLRHSVAYRMIREENQRMVDVQLRLRHATLQTTARVYGHLRRR